MTVQAYAGQRALAALLAQIAPLSAYKDADETVSAVTFQNDDSLFLPVDANSTYFFVAIILYAGGTAGSSDINTQWSVPASSTLTWMGISLFDAATGGTIGDTVLSGALTASGQLASATGGSGVNKSMIQAGSLVTGSAGTFQFQWGPHHAAVATTVKAGSILVALKLP